MPAVCGSCSRIAVAPAERIWAVSSSALRAQQRSYVARSAGPSGCRVLRAVEAVVQSLRDAEELGVALHDDPAHVQPRAADVADQRAQHLGHATAEGGRVDGPQRAVAEQLAAARDRALEAGEALGREHAGEALRGQGADRDVKEGHGTALSRPVTAEGGIEPRADLPHDVLSREGRGGERERDPELLVLGRPELVEREHVDALDVAQAGGERRPARRLSRGSSVKPGHEHVADPDRRARARRAARRTRASGRAAGP